MVPLLIVVLAVAGVSGEFTDPHCDGKQVIVHLFEWKWTDIAQECERFLGPKGYCGVQVSPANEHVMVTKEYPRPWWERYQPVSYKLTSRSGNEDQFKDMVQRCKKVGVRVFVDVVVNHMAGLGRKGQGTAGSNYDSDALSFPGVPFGRDNFNDKSKCPSGDGMVNNYGDPNNVRNCYLVGLTDLDQSQEYVRDKIAGFFNHMIDIGVAGFRVDAAKHMWPGDIGAIQGKLKNVDGGGKPFFYHEVIDQNDGAIKVTEYESLGYVTEFRYCQKIAWGIKNFGQLGGVVDYGWGMTKSSNAFVFVDNHDNQRGHGGGGNLLTHKQPRDYKMAVAFTLAYNYGFTRVMSSYSFDSTDQGPPHNSDFSAKDVTINQDGSCGNGWVCEHRWNPIGNMVAFRNAVTGTDLNNWYNQGDVVAFGRGNKGFFAMAKQGHAQMQLKSGMPAGSYCDLISDCKKKINVDGNGMVSVNIDNNDEPIMAIIVGGHSTGGGDNGNHGTQSPGGTQTDSPVVTQTDAPVTMPPVDTSGFQRTIIFLEKPTSPGQDVFIRGGIDHTHLTGCTQDASTSKCAIPIKHQDLGSSSFFSKYNAWSVGDNYLDFYGAEAGQGSSGGQAAQGSPSVWTSNKAGDAGYNSLNKWGMHYWMLDIMMDCGRTENGWFELKGVVNGNWEGDIFGQKCTGTGAADPGVVSNDHIARCGYMNVFHWSRPECEIDNIP
ncbi:alpha-amylase [Patella vulgata]|uniref:alpha-amylase n=1 Tax=Patella vulgata TaxID=6465 RepID=UPI0024A97E41|nr:alpha-amylase [Patella vulgata]